ncbi:hypothetical protein P154DRAFT_566231 [Amniculicola lignicola CBS 123094]|uniref:Uncharacterized protein n=1 Tax=Amniculicola lignicola CBS 123094 TaxID=1392246 RepID=A0A6A5W5K4_9PLEO|nr:hypothetical protein P154DRAFT_566231 [Amniculicola lignicola CBS 123094]
MERLSSTPESIELLKDLFDKLPSPTAIIDCRETPYAALEGPCLHYSNPKLDAWLNRTLLTTKDRFKMWATNQVFWNMVKSGKRHEVTHQRITWATYFIGERWGILQSMSSYDDQIVRDREEFPRPRKRPRHSSTDDVAPLAPTVLTPASESQSFLASSPQSDTTLDVAVHDWTRRDIPDASPYVQFLRKYGWSNTKFGPLEQWNPMMRSYINFLTSNPGVRCVYIGRKDPTSFYNEKTAHILGTMHPCALGVSGSVGSGPTWEFKFAKIQEVWQTGKAVSGDPLYHPTPRNGLVLAETHYNWAMMPIFDEHGNVFGVLGEFDDCSEEVIKRRMLDTEIRAREMEPADNIEKFWTKTHDVVAANPIDFPYAMFYSTAEESRSGHYGSPTSGNIMPAPFQLQSVIGLNDHPLAVNQFDIADSKHALAKYFRTAWFSGNEVTLHAGDAINYLPDSLQIHTNHPDTKHGHGSTSHTAIICPIRMIGCPGSVGILLLGLNPQRHFDESFKGSVKVMIDQFSQKAANILIPKERENYMLHQRKVQESIYAKVAELSKVGIAIYQPTTNRFTWTNEKFDKLVNLRKHKNIPVHPDDEEQFNKNITELTKAPTESCFQFRIRKGNEDKDVDNSQQWSWVLIKAASEKINVSSINPKLLSRITNDQKKDNHQLVDHITFFMTENEPKVMTDKEQKEQVQELLENKNQSENFIDMTCHELRNPLSAIIQSADGILTAFGHSDTDNGAQGSSSELSNANHTQVTVLDSAQTILLCAQHQKRIVDDILTMSKLDSERLLIAPERGRPVSLVERALTMYEAELADAGIEKTFRVDASYAKLAVDSVYLDTSRLLQVLINLLTNAIKFTRKSTTRRKIEIVLGASQNRPSTSSCNISFIPQRTARNDACSGPEWGTGEEVYLQFDVIDTGKGLTAEEMKQLFLRFSQASAKTYSQYGGSGLGLFISRELTELHGGQIGVYSIAGQGAKFAFYIKARRHALENDDSRGIPPIEADPSAEKVKHGASASLAYSEASALNHHQLPSDLHILLVEDNLINQKVTANQLRNIGCTVHVANHGVECLKFLETSAFYCNPSERENSTLNAQKTPLSVILLDQEMPVMGGLTCVKRIREMQKLGNLGGHVPVIGCTGNARREQVAKCLTAGMDDVITKPFRIKELMAAIFELVGKVRGTERR